jgi:RNA polymerase sigma-70 factor, ECF subfamily
MDYRNRYDGIKGYAVWIIRYKARQLVGSTGFNESDIEDLEQEMMLEVFFRLPKYDSKKAKLSTFISRILEHRISTIIEERNALKRDLRLCKLSLNDEVRLKEGGTVKRIDGYDIEEYIKRTGRLSRSLEEKLDISIDLKSLIASLPQDLRTLCERLKTKNVTEISRDTGIPRSTLYERINKLRKLLEDSGLRDYL